MEIKSIGKKLLTAVVALPAILFMSKTSLHRSV